MQTIERTLSALSVGRARRHRNLAVFPLLAAGETPQRYLMLDDALEAGAATVTEVSEAGAVPELALENAADAPVLLVDGEELRGARQNRILNITILVGAGRKQVIPVSCVERGRWSYRSRTFGASHTMLFAKARKAKIMAVNAGIRAHGSARADQGQIWDDIDERFAAASARSATAAMSDLYEAEQARLDGYQRAFEWQEGQVGAVFAIDGEPVAVELFDAQQPFRKFMKKAIGSFAMDAVAADRPRTVTPSLAKVRAFLAQVQAAPVERFAATGEGEDLRIEGDGVAGGALEVDGAVVHLSAFRV